ncbi:MAG: hypothetical protein AMXMBFR4_31810 [Candidatus Hydrogenedentota bacterium]
MTGSGGILPDGTVLWRRAGIRVTKVDSSLFGLSRVLSRIQFGFGVSQVIYRALSDGG